MKKSVLALAALAAIGFSGAAFAEEATKGSSTTGPAVMSDSDMDGVTAGAGATVSGQGPGVTVTLPANANANARVEHYDSHAAGNAATRN